MTMNDLQRYMVLEYVADYRAGYLLRRDLVRRVLNITGGVGSAATLLLGLGCSAPAAPAPTAAPVATTAAAKPAAASPAAAASASSAANASPAVSPSSAASASPAAVSAS